MCRVPPSLRPIFSMSGPPDALHTTEVVRECLHTYAASQNLRGPDRASITLDRLMVRAQLLSLVLVCCTDSCQWVYGVEGLTGRPSPSTGSWRERSCCPWGLHAGQAEAAVKVLLGSGGRLGIDCPQQAHVAQLLPSAL